MRHLDTLEPGERFTLPLTRRTGTVLDQHEGSVRVRWDAREYFDSFLVEYMERPRTEHVSRKTEVES